MQMSKPPKKTRAKLEVGRGLGEVDLNIRNRGWQRLRRCNNVFGRATDKSFVRREDSDSGADDSSEAVSDVQVPDGAIFAVEIGFRQGDPNAE